ncbi:MAG TPA: serine/threonine-protein kinase [Ktedonobacterales bacterium]
MTGGEGTLTGRIIGAHHVGELIGTGPLAEVYQARHPGLPQPVALKVFVSAVAADSLYVETMREIVGRSRHLEADDVLPVYDIGRDGEFLFLSMPLMRESLRDVVRSAAPLPLHRAVPLLRQIAYGLSVAHAAGIIHLDLKPENVLLDADGQAYISDFGIGRDLTPESIERRSLTTLASLIGTPAYMAPEQLRGHPTDQRADVYALGVIFYEMLTGVTPFSGNTIYEVAAQVLTRRIPPPSQHVAGIAPLVERAVLRALTRDPAERWPTVQRFMVGLNAALPARPDLSDGLNVVPGGPAQVHARPVTPPHLLMATEGTAQGEAGADGIADEAVRDNASTRKAPDRANSANSANSPDLFGNSGTVVVPDLRLFHVDPLPPQSKRGWHMRLLLLGIALALVGILILGGALLANAAQPTHNKSGAGTSTPLATMTPAQGNSETLTMPYPAAKRAATGAPSPTPPHARGDRDANANANASRHGNVSVSAHAYALFHVVRP